MKIVRITKHVVYDDKTGSATFTFRVSIGLIKIRFHIPETQMLNFISFLLQPSISRFETPEFRCAGSFEDIIFTPKQWRNSILNDNIGAEEIE